MFKVRKWERFQFMIDYEAHQVQRQWLIGMNFPNLTNVNTGCKIPAQRYSGANSP
jgi:hypothetical protein